MSEEPIAHMGSTVKIVYRGGVAGETPSDERGEDNPLTVLLGDMQVPLGIERAIVDMHPGESKDVVIPPELGYGNRNEDLCKWYPRTMLNDGYKLKTGDFLWYNDRQNNLRTPAWVVEETADNVKIDLNHPLAGETLEYSVRLLEIL